MYRSGQGLDGVSSLFDPLLKGKRVEFSWRSCRGSGGQGRAHGERETISSFVHTRYDNPMQDMVADIRSGEIDLGVLWGPYAGYFRLSWRGAV